MECYRWLLVLLTVASCFIVSTVSTSNHLDVTIIGGTGDLAKRYLWKGFFNLFVTNFAAETHNKSVRFVGAGIRELKVEMFEAMLENCIQCSKMLPDCDENKKMFMGNSTYVQLKDESDYHHLCSRLISQTYVSHEIIFYLSVPPSAYQSIVKNITLFCDVKNAHRVFKFVFEKPFGSDLESSLSLSSMLDTYLDEDQIYRIDHYLGKQAVSEIMKFRKKNKDLEKIWNRKFVSYVDINVKEIIGCKGRVSYYDNAGVFRDMLQSHLMEMMSLLTMSTETDGKVELLNSVAQIKNSDVLIGQYQGYLEEVSEEKGESISKTPTFAVAKIGVENPNWKSVPIFLSSGKRMDERVGYARVVFKTMPRRNKLKRDCTNVASQVIFYVGHGSLGTPAILVHKSLPLRSNYLPVGWLDTERFHNATLFGAKANCFRIFTPAVDKDAYTFLIEQLYMGNKMYFVTNKSLVESWRIWTPVLKMKLHPKVYPPGILSATSLRYKVTDHNLQFSKKYEQAQSLLSNLFLKRCNIKPFVIPFLGQYATIGPMSYVIKELAEDLELATLANLKESFHVALSGGSSPLYLYEYIIQNKRTSIPWEKMNIWQADERCSAEHSNFRYLEEILLGNITIDPTRVHPMLARIEGHVCSNEAVQNYQEEIQKNVCNGNRCSFHFILLGMGSDGHTASIFPYNEGVYENKRYVTVVNVTARDVVSPQRMTLTLKTINDSKHIAILITGRNKCRILKELTQLKKCGTYDVPGDVIEKYPICGVVLENRVVRWYIVEDAQSCMK